MKEYHVLSLGAGVQSTTIYLLTMDGELDVRFDGAVFADTQDEPDAVYRHLEWLESLGGPPIHRVTAGSLGRDLVEGTRVTTYGKRFASIPAFTAPEQGKRSGMCVRQCTRDYKVRPVEKWIREGLVGLRRYQHFPKDSVKVHQYMGFSYDEPGRAARTRARFAMSRWGEVHFPLIDLEMTRSDCVKYLEGRVPHTVPRSACVFCPYKNDMEWRHLKETDPSGWKRAVEIDHAIRTDGSARHGIDQKLYLHCQCVPLDQVDLGDAPGMFEMDCEGGCGL